MIINTHQYFTYANRSKSPCLDCKMRDVDCHSICILYEDFKDDLNMLKNKMKENIERERSPRSYDYQKWRNSYCGGKDINKYYR